jgi:hypothetical protein
MVLRHIHSNDKSRQQICDIIQSDRTAIQLYDNTITKIEQTVGDNFMKSPVGFLQNIADLLEIVARELSQHHSITVECYPNGKIVCVLDNRIDFELYEFDTVLRGQVPDIETEETIRTSSQAELFVFETIHTCLTEISRETDCT